MVFNFLTVRQIPGTDLFHSLPFLSGMLPTYHIKNLKTRVSAKELSRQQSGLEVPGTGINRFAPNSIKDYERSYKHKPSQTTSRHLHHFKGVKSSLFLLFICC